VGRGLETLSNIGGWPPPQQSEGIRLGSLGAIRETSENFGCQKKERAQQGTHEGGVVKRRHAAYG